MSKVCLIANQIKKIEVDINASYIGIDAGALYCMEHNIPMSCAIGDFDSIDDKKLSLLKEYTEVIQLPCEKDEVDSECALKYASAHFDEIELYGVFGGRMDHFMILYQYLKKGDINFKMIDDQNIISLLKPGVHQIKKTSTYISFYPLKEQTLSLEGFKYNVDAIVVDEFSLYLSSNEVIEEGIVTCSGSMVMMQTRDIKKDVN